MSSLRTDIPQVKSLSEAREFIAELLDTVTLYGNVLGQVLPTLDPTSDLRDLVLHTLNP